MKKIVNRILRSNKFNKYCKNVMKMYGYGNAALAA